MKKHRKWIQIAILIVLAAVGVFTLADSLTSKDKIPRVGDTAPDFQLVGLDGQVYKLSEYRGKVVMLNFWGTWCPPCKEEMPDMQAQYEKWQQAGLEILAVNLGESKVTVDSFIREYGLTFPALLDPQMDIRKQYGVYWYPTTFFIDRSGKITAKVEQQMDERFIEQNLIKLLGTM